MVLAWIRWAIAWMSDLCLVLWSCISLLISNMSQKEEGNKRFDDLYTKQQVLNLLISYNVNIRSLVKIGAVWAFHFECEMIRIAFSV